MVAIEVSNGNTASGADSVGDAVAGTLTISDTKPRAPNSTPDYGIYNDSTTFMLEIGAGSWTGATSSRVANDRDRNGRYDGFDFQGAAGDVSGTSHPGYVPAAFGMSAREDFPPEVWTTSLISELFSLEFSDWPGVSGSLRFDKGSVGSNVWENVRFQVDALQPVPEPCSLLLMGLGTSGVAWACRRRRRLGAR